MRSMARIGCYVLLKSRLNCKEIRTKTSVTYENGRYTIEQNLCPEGNAFTILYGGYWRIYFNRDDILYIRFYKQEEFYYYWYEYYCADVIMNKVKELTNYLANCRFDLVYKLMNEING
jgi:hypothetical protein